MNRLGEAHQENRVCKQSVCSEINSQPYFDPKKSENVQGKISLLNNVPRLRSCSAVAHGCVNRIRFWPLRRDKRSRVLIGAGGTWCSDWPECVKVIDVRTRSDR